MTTIPAPPLLLACPPRIGEVTPRFFRVRKRYVAAAVILAVLCLPVACVFGILGYFRLSSDTNALRDSFMSSAPGRWEKKFAAHAGSFTFGAARAVSQFFPLPPEPRAALNAVRGAEVGIYNLAQESAPAEPLTVLQNAERTMTRRGWLRIVCVAQEHELVAIYMPSKGVSEQRMTCCLAVLKDRELVVVSVRGNVEPLLQLAAAKGFGSNPSDYRLSLAAR